MRIIDADALKEEIGSWGMNDYEPADFIDAIDNAPTVENITIFCENADEKTIDELKAEMQKAKLALFEERPQGEWLLCYTPKKKKVFKCNKCLVVSIQGQTNFCPNCGAKMKGGAE